MNTKRVQSSTNCREDLKAQEAPAAASDGKSRRIVTVDPNGKARVTPMPPKVVRVSKSRPSTKGHPRPALASKRSTAVNGPRECYACADIGDVRQYEAREVGKVALCDNCGEKAREETFGRRDPLDFALLGGGFESNRRKY